MNAGQRNVERLRPLIARLTAAAAANDAGELERVLDDLVHAHRRDLFAELKRLTTRVQSALEVFGLDARFAAFAETDMPDARQRLTHVMTLTDDAAHRTLGLIERCTPLVDELIGAASPAADVSATAAQLRRNLSDMLLAQGYQDLTGQILRGVITLVDEVETALSSLIGLSGDESEEAAPPAGRRANPNGYGPVVPGVAHGVTVANQHDVDALLSGLGL